MPFLVSLKQRSFLGILPLRAGVFVLGALQTIEGALLLTRYRGHESTTLRRLSIVVAVCNIADGLTATYTSWRPEVVMALATACGFLLDAILHILMFIIRWEELYGSLKDWLSISYVISHIAIFIILVYMVRTSFTLYQVLKLGGTGMDFKSPADLLEDKLIDDNFEKFRHNESLDERDRIADSALSAYTETPVYI